MPYTHSAVQSSVTRVAARHRLYLYMSFSLFPYMYICILRAGLPQRPPLSLCRVPCFPLSLLPPISVTLLYRCTARKLSRADQKGKKARVLFSTTFTACCALAPFRTYTDSRNLKRSPGDSNCSRVGTCLSAFEHQNLHCPMRIPMFSINSRFQYRLYPILI